MGLRGRRAGAVLRPVGQLLVGDRVRYADKVEGRVFSLRQMANGDVQVLVLGPELADQRRIHPECTVEVLS